MLEALLATELELEDTGTGLGSTFCCEDDTSGDATGFGAIGATGLAAGTLLETEDDTASTELDELLSSMTIVGCTSGSGCSDSEELTEDSDEASSVGGIRSAARCSISVGRGICVNLCAWYV